jgi:hypothetical protein
MMLNIEFQKAYAYEVIDYSFDRLSADLVSEIYLDGRVFSHFSERLIQKLFPELTRVDKKYFDYTRNGFTRRVENKTFTQRELAFVPSSMLGVGRKYDEEKFHEIADRTDYVIVDNSNFPHLKIVFDSGTNLIKRYPKGKVSKTKRQEFWDYYGETILIERFLNEKVAA